MSDAVHTILYFFSSFMAPPPPNCFFERTPGKSANSALQAASPALAVQETSSPNEVFCWSSTWGYVNCQGPSPGQHAPSLFVGVSLDVFVHVFCALKRGDWMFGPQKQESSLVCLSSRSGKWKPIPLDLLLDLGLGGVFVICLGHLFSGHSFLLMMTFDSWL